MTVRGDSWAVCMVCTPLCFTLLAKGRRVLSQVLLSSIKDLLGSLTGDFAVLVYIGFIASGSDMRLLLTLIQIPRC